MINLTKRFLFLSIISYLILIPKLVLADTYVSEVTTDEVWVEDLGPYYVNDLYIPPGVNIEIGAGTQVFVNGYIAVFGSMNLLGDENNKVVMDLDPDASNWYIYVGDLGTVDLTNSIIKQADGITVSDGDINFLNVQINGSFSGVVVSGQSELSAENLSINDLVDGTAIMVFNGSVANISNSIINGSLAGGNYAVAGYHGGDINILNTEILTIFDTPIIMVGGNLNLENVSVVGGSDNGIELLPSGEVSAKANIINSTIKDFDGDGIFAIDPYLVVSGSSITGNAVGVESYARNNFSLKISSSTIESNVVGTVFGIQYSDAVVTYDVRNNWWGDASGPIMLGKNESGLGDSIIAYNSAIESVQFEPWLLAAPGQDTCCSNVIFLPGLEASRLYRQEFFENQLWEPNRNLDIKKLYLDSSGSSVEDDIYTRDILGRTNIGSAVGLPGQDKDIYRNFSLSMDSLVSDGLINEWKPFPYDWRFDYSDLIENGIKLQNEIINIIPEIERLSVTSRTSKVTIITHSNGGLFAKVLIKKLEEIGAENYVDKIIMVAAPQLGTPTAIGALLHGDEQQLGRMGILMSHETARGLAENMKPAYNMLPSEKYFEDVLEPVVLFDSSVDRVGNLRTKYGDSIGSYSAMKDFVLATRDGRAKPSFSDIFSPNVLNTPMMLSASDLHTQLDSWGPPDSIKLTEIAGWGINTTKGHKYTGISSCLPGSSTCINTLDHELIKTIDGDGTVLSPSAIAGPGDKYYVNINKYNQTFGPNIDHKAIMEINYLGDFIKNIIQNNSDLPEYVTSDKPVDINNSNIRIAMHSPVSIDAYDSLGNHTGIFKNPDPEGLDFVESNIPNSSYEEVGEGKYIYINGEDNPKVLLQGLGSGTFTLNISKSENGIVVESNFTDIPTNSNMEGQIVVGANSTSLVIDVEGDGIDDVTISPNQDLDPITYLTIIKKTLDGFDISTKTKNGFIKRIDAIIKSIEKGKIKNGLKKVKDFNKKLKSLIKKKLNKHHHKKINKEDSQIFISMLNELLNLLETK